MNPVFVEKRYYKQTMNFPDNDNIYLSRDV